MSKEPEPAVTNGDLTDHFKGQKLLEIVRAFVAKHDITCEETIFQTDRVIENAYDFMADLVKVAGFAPSEDDDD